MHVNKVSEDEHLNDSVVFEDETFLENNGSDRFITWKIIFLEVKISNKLNIETKRK